MTELEKYMTSRVVEEIAKRKADNDAKLAEFKALLNTMFTAEQIFLLQGKFDFSLGLPTFTFGFFSRHIEMWSGGATVFVRYDTTRKEHELKPYKEWDGLISYLLDCVPFEVRQKVKDMGKKDESAATTAKADNAKGTAAAVHRGAPESGNAAPGRGHANAQEQDSRVPEGYAGSVDTRHRL